MEIILTIFCALFFICLLLINIYFNILTKMNKNKSLFFFLIFLLRTLIFIISLILFNHLILSNDSYRYLYEINEISKNPFAWNPFTGEGAYGYDETPKMGMSYLYGVVAFIFNSNPFITSIILNYYFSMLTLVYLYKIFDLYLFTKTTYIIYFILAFHPEMFIWNIRILRETLGIFLVVYIVYLLVKMIKQKYNSIEIIYLIFNLVLLFLVRRQLILVALLGIIFWLSNIIRNKFKNRLIFYFSFLFFSILLYFLIRIFFLPLFESVMGSHFSRLFLLDINYIKLSLQTFIPNLLEIFSLKGEGYGLFNYLIIPFTLLKIIMLCMLILNYLKLKDSTIRMLIFIIMLFYITLILNNAINMRFAIYLTPLIFISFSYILNEILFTKRRI